MYAWTGEASLMSVCASPKDGRGRRLSETKTREAGESRRSKLHRDRNATRIAPKTQVIPRARDVTIARINATRFKEKGERKSYRGVREHEVP